MAGMSHRGCMGIRALAITWVLMAGCVPGSWAGEVDPALLKMFDHYQAEEGEIEFYGKVLDQEGAPVAGASVRISMPTQKALDAPLIARERVILTDSNGCYEISKQTWGEFELRGHDLIIAGIMRAGYEAEKIPLEKRGFSFSRSNAKRFVADPLNPVVYRMRKKGECAFLLEDPHWQLRLPLTPSPQARGYDFIQRRPLNGGDAPSADDAGLTCDLRARVMVPANGTAWQVVLSPGDATGGILVSDSWLHEAPEQGYQTECIVSWPGLGQAATKYVYLKSRDPAIYTRLEIGYINASGESFLLDGKSVTNPYGDRTLEAAEGLPYEVTKQLTDEAREAFQQNKHPAKPDLKRLIPETTAGAEKGPG